MIDPKDTRMDELDEAGLREADATFGATGNLASAIRAYLRASTIGGEPVATQYRYWYSSGEPGVWLNERRKDADDLLESGVLIREETRALYLSEAGAETSLRNVQRSGGGWQPADTAPHACHMLVTYFDEEAGEWVVGVEMRPLASYWTHWQHLPASPELRTPRQDSGE